MSYWTFATKGEDKPRLTDTFEDYEDNKYWIFFAYLMHAQEICKERRRAAQRKVDVKIDSNDKAEARVAVRKVRRNPTEVGR